MVSGFKSARYGLLATVVVLAVVLSLLLTSPVHAGLTLYEFFLTNDAAADVYSDTWIAQTFTVGSDGHTVSSVEVRLLRTGTSPGDVTLSLRATASNEPDGPDLVSTLLNGNAISTDPTWYSFSFEEPYYLEPDTQYAVVLQAISGISTDKVGWRYNATGGEADGKYWASSDGGNTWADNASYDLTFKVWGVPGLEVYRANVYKSFSEEEDWLIVTYYSDILAPYYPNSNPSRYFSLQLVADDGTTVLAQGPVRAWGSRPGAIYLSAATVASLEWQEDYRVRIYGNYGANPSDSYTLTSGDWRGDDLSQLDDWCILTAKDMEGIDGVSYTLFVGGEGEMLNEDGGVLFDNGIANLSAIRGDNLFSIYWIASDEEARTFTGALQTDLDWESKLGSDVSQSMSDAGDTVGVDGKLIGLLGMVGIYLLLAALCVTKGHTIAGIILAIPTLLVGMGFGLIDVVYVAVLASIASLLFVWHMWLRQT